MGEQKKTAKQLFWETVRLDPQERESYLARHCPDETVRAEVESLLRHFEADSAFLATPVLEQLSETEVRATLESDPDEEVVSTTPPEIPGYKILREIGSGMTGTVYLAEELALKRPVALKVLRRSTSGTPSSVLSFRNEARSSGKLIHPGIVPVFHFGEEDGIHFIAMEYVAGKTLESWLSATRNGEHPPLTIDDAVRISIEIADALDCAHRNGIWHRDVKPENILIDERGSARLTDFGIAKNIEEDLKTETGIIAGTFAYMSPEQARAERVRIDARTDLFSLGVVLYEMITLARPFTGETLPQIVEAVISKRHQAPRSHNPRIALALEAICNKALEKEPEDRFATADEMRSHLRAFQEGEPIPIQSPGLLRRTQLLVRRRPIPVALAGTLLTVAIALFFAWPRPPSNTLSVEVYDANSKRAIRGALISSRRLSPPLQAYEAPTTVGKSPVRNADLLPGHYRITARTDDGFAEWAQEIRKGESHRLILTILPTEEVAGGMIRVGGGTAIINLPRAGAKGGEDRSVSLDPFLIDQRETSNLEYREYLAATGQPAPIYWPDSWPDLGETNWWNRPVTGVNQREAARYALWRGKRLPTAPEWQRAARGANGWAYPWGKERGDIARWSHIEKGPGGWQRCEVTAEQSTRQLLDLYRNGTTSVYEAPLPFRDISPSGLLHTLGNVSEWTESVGVSWIENHYKVSPEIRVVVGGNWTIKTEHTFEDLTVPRAAEFDSPGLGRGFRCAKSILDG